MLTLIQFEDGLTIIIYNGDAVYLSELDLLSDSPSLSDIFTAFLLN